MALPNSKYSRIIEFLFSDPQNLSIKKVLASFFTNFLISRNKHWATWEAISMQSNIQWKRSWLNTKVYLTVIWGSLSGLRIDRLIFYVLKLRKHVGKRTSKSMTQMLHCVWSMSQMQKEKLCFLDSDLYRSAATCVSKSSSLDQCSNRKRSTFVLRLPRKTTIT